MTADEDGSELEIVEAKRKLNQGLESCQAVVDDYRAMLRREVSPNESDQIAEKSESDLAE